MVVSGVVGEEKMGMEWSDGEMVVGVACGKRRGRSWCIGCEEWKRW